MLTEAFDAIKWEDERGVQPIATSQFIYVHNGIRDRNIRSDDPCIAD